MNAFPKMNAILLAGDRRASIQLHSDNKAFLELYGIPLFIHVLNALQGAKSVNNVVIIGPKERLLSALKQHGISDGVCVVEQRDNMIENFKVGYVTSLGLDESISFDSLRGTEYENKPALIAPCDIPMLLPEEVDEFMARSNLHEYDYSIGITSERVLSHYHPKDGKTGIRMIYFHLKEDLIRHNNLHIAKPLKFKHLDYIEKMYEWRYQTRLANILHLLFSMLTHGFVMMKGLRTFTLMQLSLYYDRHGHPQLSDRLRSLVGFNRLSEGIGNAIGARVQVVYTHFGGAALDADNELDLAVIEERYEEWMDYQRIFNG
ncbi:MAG TPA: nucleotidyltransferase family protein [Pontiella sp.]